MGSIPGTVACLPNQRLRLLVHGTCYRYSSQFKNNYLTEMCSDSEAGSYLRLIDFVYHSTLGVRVIKKTCWDWRGAAASGARARNLLEWQRAV